MVSAPGGRAKHIPGQVVGVEDDGHLLVALDDEREGECVLSPECVRRMTEEEEWQNAAAVESAPGCHAPVNVTVEALAPGIRLGTRALGTGEGVVE